MHIHFFNNQEKRKNTTSHEAALHNGAVVWLFLKTEQKRNADVAKPQADRWHLARGFTDAHGLQNNHTQKSSSLLNFLGRRKTEEILQTSSLFHLLNPDSHFLVQTMYYITACSPCLSLLLYTMIPYTFLCSASQIFPPISYFCVQFIFSLPSYFCSQLMPPHHSFPLSVWFYSSSTSGNHHSITSPSTEQQ